MLDGVKMGVIGEECREGNKDRFRKKRAAFVSTWKTDENGIVHIPLKNGYEARFSQQWKELASNFSWNLKITKKKNVTKYYAEAVTTEEFREKYGKFTSLQRVILGVKGDVEVDHKDGDGLNCVDENIRIATRSQNASNRLYKNKHGYRGVVFQKGCTKHPFIAQVMHLGINHKYHSYATAVEAAIRYNEEAYRFFGEFAILNQIPGWEPESKTVPGGNGMIGDLP